MHLTVYTSGVTPEAPGTGIERRRFRRETDVDGTVSFSWKDAGDAARVQDLSQQGVRVLYSGWKGHLKPGGTATGALTVHGPVRFALRFSGRVAWARRTDKDGEMAVGVQFDSVEF